MKPMITGSFLFAIMFLHALVATNSQSSFQASDPMGRYETLLRYDDQGPLRFVQEKGPLKITVTRMPPSQGLIRRFRAGEPQLSQAEIERHLEEHQQMQFFMVELEPLKRQNSLERGFIEETDATLYKKRFSKLAFEMPQHVKLIYPNAREVQASSVVLDRDYGISGVTRLMAAFPKAGEEVLPAVVFEMDATDFGLHAVSFQFPALTEDPGMAVLKAYIGVER